MVDITNWHVLKEKEAKNFHQIPPNCQHKHCHLSSQAIRQKLPNVKNELTVLHTTIMVKIQK